MKLLFVGAVLCAVAGCTSTTGALRSGPDTYSLTTTASPGAGGLAAAKRSAFEQATAECAKTGKTVSVLTEGSRVPGWNDGMYSIDLSFRCV